MGGNKEGKIKTNDNLANEREMMIFFTLQLRLDKELRRLKRGTRKAGNLKHKSELMGSDCRA